MKKLQKTIECPFPRAIYACVSVWLFFQFIHLFQGYIYVFGRPQSGSAIRELEIVGRQYALFNHCAYYFQYFRRHIHMTCT
jgi:hypothetical protein